MRKSATLVFVGAVLMMSAGLGAVQHMRHAFMDYDHLKEFYQDLKDLESGKRTDGKMLIKDYENLSKNKYWYKKSPERITFLLGEISDLVQTFKNRAGTCDCKERFGPFDDVKPIEVTSLTFEQQRQPKAKASHAAHGKHRKKAPKK